LGEGPGGGSWRLALPVRGVFDLSDRGSLRGLAFEPEISFQQRTKAGWSYATSVSAIVADQRLAQTFYGVDARYALSNRPSYEARSGLVAWRLSASFSRNLARDWRLFGFARLDSVSGAANEGSPLVRRTSGASGGLGVAYTWMRSSERATD